MLNFLKEENIFLKQIVFVKWPQNEVLRKIKKLCEVCIKLEI